MNIMGKTCTPKREGRKEIQKILKDIKGHETNKKGVLENDATCKEKSTE